MRRFLSVLFFVLGGWMLSSQLMVAFIDAGQGSGLNLAMIGFMLLFALPFLLIAAWISPGRRWRELGLTILITAGIASFSGLSVLLLMLDPKFMRLMPPMPEIGLTPVTGLVNLALVVGAGLLLYRRGGSGEAVTMTGIGRER